LIFIFMISIFFCKFWLFSITSFNLNLWYSIFLKVVLLFLIDFYFWIFFIKLIFLFNFTLQSIFLYFLFQIWSSIFLFNLGHFVNLFFFLISLFHKKLKLFLISISMLIILITIFLFWILLYSWDYFSNFII
jgi:hypothetical protein